MSYSLTCPTPDDHAAYALLRDQHAAYWATWPAHPVPLRPRWLRQALRALTALRADTAHPLQSCEDQLVWFCCAWHRLGNFDGTCAGCGRSMSQDSLQPQEAAHG